MRTRWSRSGTYSAPARSIASRSRAARRTVRAASAFRHAEFRTARPVPSRSSRPTSFSRSMPSARSRIRARSTRRDAASCCRTASAAPRCAGIARRTSSSTPSSTSSARTGPSTRVMSRTLRPSAPSRTRSAPAPATGNASRIRLDATRAWCSPLTLPRRIRGQAAATASRRLRQRVSRGVRGFMLGSMGRREGGLTRRSIIGRRLEKAQLAGFASNSTGPCASPPSTSAPTRST